MNSDFEDENIPGVTERHSKKSNQRGGNGMEIYSLISFLRQNNRGVKIKKVGKGKIAIDKTDYKNQKDGLRIPEDYEYDEDNNQLSKDGELVATISFQNLRKNKKRKNNVDVPDEDIDEVTKRNKKKSIFSRISDKFKNVFNKFKKHDDESSHIIEENEDKIKKLEEKIKQLENKIEKMAREEAEKKAREEAEKKAREEAERKAREEAERKAREEAERKARESSYKHISKLINLSTLYKSQEELDKAKLLFSQYHNCYTIRQNEDIKLNIENAQRNINTYLNSNENSFNPFIKEQIIKVEKDERLQRVGDLTLSRDIYKGFCERIKNALTYNSITILNIEERLFNKLDRYLTIRQKEDIKEKFEEIKWNISKDGKLSKTMNLK